MGPLRKTRVRKGFGDGTILTILTRTRYLGPPCNSSTKSYTPENWNPNNPPIFSREIIWTKLPLLSSKCEFPRDSLAEASSLPLATSGEDTLCSLRIRSYLTSVISFSGRSMVGQMDGVCVDVVFVKLLTLNPFNGNYPGFYLGGLVISRIGSCPPSWTKLTLR